jgi:hypothetical protein
MALPLWCRTMTTTELSASNEFIASQHADALASIRHQHSLPAAVEAAKQGVSQ